MIRDFQDSLKLYPCESIVPRAIAGSRLKSVPEMSSYLDPTCMRSGITAYLTIGTKVFYTEPCDTEFLLEQASKNIAYEVYKEPLNDLRDIRQDLLSGHDVLGGINNLINKLMAQSEDSL